MKRAVFREDGMKAVVEIVEDNSTDEWDRYKLRIVNVLRQSPIMIPAEVGEVFSVEQKKNAGCWGGMWSLDENDAEAELG